MSFPKSVSFIAIVCIASISAVYIPCAYRDGYCVCNETYCDEFDVNRLIESGTFNMVTSSQAGKRFVSSAGTITATPLIPPILPLPDATMNIDRTTKYQQMIGFGGGVTGTVRGLFFNATEALQKQLMKSVYASSGLAYNLIRTTIGGSDFDLMKYTFYDSYRPGNSTLGPLDASVSNYDQAVGLVKILEIIRDVNPEAVKRIFAATWSPPLYMKTCEDYAGYCLLKDEYYQMYADYHVRFLEFMRRNQIEIYSISTTNEPINGLLGVTKIPCLGWYPSDQGKLNSFFSLSLTSVVSDPLVQRPPDRKVCHLPAL